MSESGVKSKKSAFLNVVQKGDIVISNVGVVVGDYGVFVGFGHAAIMATDEDVLEMSGGKSKRSVLSNNNRLISKGKWYDDQQPYWVCVHRCPDSAAAISAADWAYRNYYNSTGGHTKTINITYQITPDVWSRDPSYCSKLVLQAYYYGTGTKDVINEAKMAIMRIIPPNNIPVYFNDHYRLKAIGAY